METDKIPALFEAAVNALLMPGAYMLGIKSVREVMRDDDLRRFYGHMLLHELMPLSSSRPEAEEAALTLTQTLELSRDATITKLENGLCLARDRALPYLSADTPCMLLGWAMMIMLYAGPHDEIPQTEGALELFRGLSADLPAEDLVYAVFGDRLFWGRDVPADEELADGLKNAILDLQILGVRGAILKTLENRERKEKSDV